MDITNAMKADVIAHALPHIQAYRRKIVVVKYGGNAMINEELKAIRNINQTEGCVTENG